LGHSSSISKSMLFKISPISLALLNLESSDEKLAGSYY
jgi:hypothetical protein